MKSSSSSAQSEDDKKKDVTEVGLINIHGTVKVKVRDENLTTSIITVPEALQRYPVAINKLLAKLSMHPSAQI